MTHKNWLQERKTGIGGSDAAAVLGLSDYKTPVDVWLDKTGRTGETPDNDYLWFGRTVEPVIAKRFENESGLKVRNDNKLYRHPNYDFILANLDRSIVKPNKRNTPGVLEIKTTNRFYEQQWETDVPMSWYLQLQHYMMIRDWSWGFIAWLSDRQYRHKEFKADPELHQKMVESYRVFWGYVESNEPPPVTCSDDTLKLYLEHTEGKIIEAPESALSSAKKLAELKNAKKEVDDRIKEEEGLIKMLMGDAEAIVDSSGDTVATWKSYVVNRIDTKALKINEPSVADKYMIQSKQRRFNLKIK